MNTVLDETSMPTALPLVRAPERLLIIGPDEAWCERVREAIARDAAQLPSPAFLSWRLAYGLLRVLPISGLDAALRHALIEPTLKGARRNVTRIWTTQTEAQWYEFGAQCAAMRTPQAQGVKVSLLSADEALNGVVAAATKPDALPRLSWLMEGRPLPIPVTWLSLAPIPELSEAQNAAMTEEGYRCYTAWAENLLAAYEPEELQELWGPFDDDEQEEEKKQDVTVDNVFPLQKPRAPETAPLPDTRRHRFGGSMEPQGLESRLAAAGAGASPSAGRSPADKWTLEPAVSHGANRLEAWVRSPTEKDGKAGIEFVALWDNVKTKPESPGDICLVFTLPRHAPVLLRGRTDAQPAEGSVYSQRFDWPHERWPKNLQEGLPVHLKGKLKAVLEKARVSLM